MPTRLPYLVACALATAFILSACRGATNAVPNGDVPQVRERRHTSSPIQHIVVLVQENRTFNDLFATFPGAEGSTTGLERVGSGKNAHDVTINLKETKLDDPKNLNHLYVSFKIAYRDGHMDNFNHIKYINGGQLEGTLPYQYVNPTQVQPYWTLATDYGLADQLFQTQGSGSFTGHQDLIRGGTDIDSEHSIIDDPNSSDAWGCISPPGTKTDLITTKLKYERLAGPFPCTNQFPSSGENYKTLGDTLNAAGISWKYYAPPTNKFTVGALWNAYLVIDSIYGSQSEWSEHISIPSKNVLTDIANGTLPQMSWVIPDALDSDHPGYPSDRGPSWVANVVNALGESSYWNSTAVIVVWDDWGGFYDPVAPPLPRDKQGGPGLRVGMIVASPYVPANEISHTVYGFGSIVKFIEGTWGLPSLGTTDETSTSISDMFDFSRKPRKFKAIPAKYSRTYFLHQRPSGLPVDTE